MQGYHRRGVKLIELLVVMAIFILLAGIVYVLTGSSREASRRTQCMNNLRQIAIATYQYMIDYQALYDDPHDLQAYLQASNRSDWKKIFICPNDRLFVPIYKTATSYRYHPIEDFSPQDWKENPNQVLFTCIDHFGIPLAKMNAGTPIEMTIYRDKTAKPRWPFVIILRLGGSVEPVHVCRIRQTKRVEEGITVFRSVYPGEDGYEQAEKSDEYAHWCR